MNPEKTCTWLRDRMERYVENSLTENELAYLEMHTGHCPDCGRLLEILRGDATELSGSDADGFTKAIMDKTTGPGCDRALSLYMCQMEDEIPDSDRTLMNEHLRYCATCSEVVQTVNDLFPIMRDMAEMQPDSWFAADVIRRTRQLRWHERGIVAWISDRWERFVSSPQFGIQTAYVGALIFSLTIGSSIPSVLKSDSIPGRIAEDSRVAFFAVFSPFKEWENDVSAKLSDGWNNSTERITEYGQVMLSDMHVRFVVIDSHLEDAGYHFSKMMDSVIDGEFLDGMVHLTETGYDLKSAISALFTSHREEPDRITPLEEARGSESTIGMTNERISSKNVWRVS